MKSQNHNSASAELLIYKDIPVEKVVPGGDGLVRLEGKVVFVPGVLAGERVDLRLISEGRKFSRGVVVELRESSSERTEPFCPHYGICGGCNLQHSSYEHQISLKTSFAREHFSRHAGMELPAGFRFVPSEPRGYRNRVQFHRAAEGAGFKKRGSDRILPLTECPVLCEGLNAFLSSGESPAHERETFFGDSRRFWSESGGEDILVTIGKKPVRFRADLFFQSNISLLPDMIEFALQGAEGDHGMDLYCGVGLFSVFMADRFERISGVELNPRVESFYRGNMEGRNFEFSGRSLEEWLKKGRKAPCDFILVDPPRTGLSPKARNFLARVKVPRLSYISCDPVTQARDTKELLAAGYELEDARGFDLYPQTHHMETVLRFRRP